MSQMVLLSLVFLFTFIAQDYAQVTIPSAQNVINQILNQNNLLNPQQSSAQQFPEFACSIFSFLPQCVTTPTTSTSSSSSTTVTTTTTASALTNFPIQNIAQQIQKLACSLLTFLPQCLPTTTTPTTATSTSTRTTTTSTSTTTTTIVCASNEYLNNSNCVSKLLLYFSTSNYTTINIYGYNGTNFTRPNDVTVIEQPSYYIYVADITGFVVQLNQSGSYVRDTSVQAAWSLQSINNSIYVVSPFGDSGPTIYKLNSDLNRIYNSTPANSTIVVAQNSIRYNPSNGYLYECDIGSGYVNVFDTSFNRIDNESFKLDSDEKPLSTQFYQSKTLGNLIFLSTTNNCIKIIKQSDKTTINQLCSICRVGYPNHLIVEQKSGYLVASCLTDRVLHLLQTNGTDITDTGKNKSLDSSGMYFDSNGRLLLSRYTSHYISILTTND